MFVFPRERERSECERLSPFPQCQECVYIEDVQVVPAQTGCVVVGKRPKGDRVHHALVEHQSVLLGVGGDLELFGGRMTREKMGVDHGHIASVVEGVGEFIEDVLPQDGVMQLPEAPHVEGEAAHLAFHFATLGLVPIILGAAGGEIHDVVVPFQLVRHFPQVIPRRDVGLTGKVGVDDGVGVEVEDLFLQPVQVLVQFQSGVTGGEGGDEEVDAPAVRLVVSGVRVHHFQRDGVADPHRVDVVGGVGDELEEMRGGGDDLGGGLAEVFPEFAPERVEHEFGRGFPTWVLDEAFRVEVDALALVVADVPLFLLGSAGPTRVAGRFLLDLEPGVDVLGIAPRATLRFGKVPDFVDRQNRVPLFHGLDELWGAPGPAQGAFVGGVGAAMTSLEERFGHLGLDALGAEGKGEFTPVTMGQHGMVESERREDVHLGQTKVLRDVGVAGVGQDLGMSDGVGLRLVDPLLQRRHVQVLDPFPSGRVGLVMQFDGVGSSAEKGVPWLQWVHPVAGSQEGLERSVGLDLSVPVALPEDAEPVAAVPQRPVFLLGGVVHFLQGPVWMEFGTLVALLGETPRAPVPHAPVELVDGEGGGVVPVHEVLAQKGLLSAVVGVSDAVGLGGGRRVRRVDAKTMLLPRQPLQGFGGLIGPSTLPASTGFGRDGADGQEFFRQKRLQAEAMVTHLTKGLNSALASNSSRNVWQPALSSLTSDSQ